MPNQPTAAEVADTFGKYVEFQRTDLRSRYDVVLDEPPLLLSEAALVGAVEVARGVTRPTAKRYVTAALDEPDSPLVAVYVHRDGRLGSVRIDGEWVSQPGSAIAGGRDNAWCQPHVSTSLYLIDPSVKAHDDVRVGTYLVLRDRLADAIDRYIVAYEDRNQRALDERRTYLASVDAEFPGLRKALVDVLGADGRLDRARGGFDFHDTRRSVNDTEMGGQFSLTISIYDTDLVHALAAALGVEGE